ncbi:MAG TPA: aminopeptidase [Candidatus Coproplasma avicola]|uniref:M18 family aminopeptidase n=1 Tax=Candidatus Coproplasma avicola TaxID=2840744 RepID=A0A9D1E5C3_9FIRM|nr:aminopeptidase [Candidatus Coproplasma avicola]
MQYEYIRKNYFKEAEEAERKAIFDYAEGYKNFLFNSKTERGACATAKKLCEERGYKPYMFGDKVKAGDKLYFINRDKNIFIIKIGTNDISECGIKIMAAHVDSPRLDLKPNPLYEDGGLAFFKTHYYGGIKKYQWPTIALALEGVVVLRGGERVAVNVGDDENDPVFYITDLLPHLSQEQNELKLAKAISGESLNAIVGAMPDGCEDKEGVKAAVLKLLHDKYGISEIDFQTSELCFVPAGKPRDVGFDRALISAYGHDDKVCAYPEMTALFESDGKDTVMAIFADKEETGSQGVTGMQSRVIVDIIDSLSRSLGADPILVRYNSKCISADVCAAFDPEYASVYEKRNSSYINCGASVTKYHGARGKSSTNDASAEMVGYVRDALEDNGVIYQTGELGKIDIGGGGTVAMYIADLGIDTLDMGVPVLSMHAPYEIISKADLYSMHKAMLAFVNKH